MARRKTELEKELEAQRQEVEEALNGTLEDTIRHAGPANALAWLGVALGSFLINLLLLVLVTGG